MYMYDFPIGIDKYHIEQNKCIFHPHCYDSFVFELEQHSLIIGHIFDEHESFFSFFLGLSESDLPFFS